MTMPNIRRLEKWPRAFTKNRRRGPFQVTYPKILDDLDRELELLNAHTVVIEVAVRDESDIRLRDGHLRSTAVLDHPGVMLSFVGRHGPMRFACDTYDGWYANLRAIGLTLTALRAVDRYGATTSGEQYTGWKQLPASVEIRDDPYQTLARYADIDVEGVMRDPQAAFRIAARRTHPDQNGAESTADFQRVNEAWKRIGAA